MSTEQQFLGDMKFPIPAGYNDIIKVLPHRFPFLFIDRVIEAVEGESLTALKNVTSTENYLQGHFPQFPVMPGVLQLEALAQAAAILSMTMLTAGDQDKIPFLMSMDKVKFRRPVVPGDQLILKVTILTKKATIGKVKAVASVAGKVTAEAIITAAIRDVPKA